jgi:hypothetical protein
MYYAVKFIYADGTFPSRAVVLYSSYAKRKCIYFLNKEARQYIHLNKGAVTRSGNCYLFRGFWLDVLSEKQYKELLIDIKSENYEDFMLAK